MRQEAGNDSDSRDGFERRQRDDFATTRWSLVLRAARNSEGTPEALEELCQAYWRPLYFYARRRVADRQEAQDLTQAFFVQILEKRVFESADPLRGKFRAFLLTSFKHFLTNHWQKRNALKRGGG
ncbi:MAG: sigma factor, partial [Planctomycetota bacterium]